MTLIETLEAVCAKGKDAKVLDIDVVITAFEKASKTDHNAVNALVASWNEDFRAWDMRGRHREKQGPMPSSRDHRLTVETIDSYPEGTRTFMAIRTMLNSGVPINTSKHKYFDRHSG